MLSRPRCLPFIVGLSAAVCLWGGIVTPTVNAQDVDLPVAPPEAGTNNVTDAGVADLPLEDGREAAYDHIELLAEVLLHIRKSYAAEKTYKDLTYGALHGMLVSLDPHSAFLEPEEYSEMQEDTSGRFGGIGIHVGMRNGVLTVIAPIEGTPAFKAGLISGDRIVGIDGEKTIGATLRDAVTKLRGEKGSKVVLTISREGVDETIEVEILRDEIKVPSVKGTEMLRGNIGYTRITQFAHPTLEMFDKAINELEEKGMEALVIDLRSNPGGLLASAIGVAERLLPAGKLIVTTKGREDVYPVVETKARPGHGVVGKPIVVLVNGGSASAAEIVAGALKSHKRAVLVGQTTFGKASVQSVVRLKAAGGKSAIRLTTAHYYTPDGREIHGEGIAPDIEVVLTPVEWAKVQVRRARDENPALYTEEEKKLYEGVVDTQLLRALDLLQAVLIFKAE